MATEIVFIGYPEIHFFKNTFGIYCCSILAENNKSCSIYFFLILKSHEDYRGLERAKEAMVDVAQYTNEVKRDSEHLVVIQKVKESIIDLNLPNGNDLQQYGHLLLDGDLNIKAHEDQKTKHRYAFIFEKLLILVKNSNSKIGVSFFLF